MKLYLALLALLPAVSSFQTTLRQPSWTTPAPRGPAATTPKHLPSHSPLFLSSPKETPNDDSSDPDKLPNLPNFGEWTEKVNVDRLTDNADAIKNNIFEGEIGERGEGYVVVQFGLLVCIALGTIPFGEDILRFLFGPGILLLGVLTMILSVLELGPSLSPWPVVTSSQSELVTTGPFAVVRHPIYSGLLAACFGFSVVTESIVRLLLTALLLRVLDAKVEFEEEDMMESFPADYPMYQEAVKGKFFPRNLFDGVDSPWNKEEGEDTAVEEEQDQEITEKEVTTKPPPKKE